MHEQIYFEYCDFRQFLKKQNKTKQSQWDFGSIPNRRYFANNHFHNVSLSHFDMCFINGLLFTSVIFTVILLVSFFSTYFLDTKNNDGETAFHWAMRAGQKGQAIV